MEMLLIFLSTAIGTVVGVVAAVVMMQRKGNLGPTKAELALRVQLQNVESQLAAATAGAQDARTKLAERDQKLAEREQTILQIRADLDRQHQQLEAVMAEAQKGPPR